MRYVVLTALSVSLLCLDTLPACSKDLPNAAATSISVCFVPNEDCTQFIVDAINLAKTEVLVQAYNYTSTKILQAVVHAKKEKNLDVRVILDKSNEQPRYTGATYTQNSGIPVLIDNTVVIAHNKVIIIDGLHVITGSFNFTTSAQTKNTENVILIMDNPEVAQMYRNNWFRRAEVSRPFAAPQTQSKP